MPRAEKRQRKKENARAARAEREAAIKRRKRNRTIITVAGVAAGFVVLVLLINLITGGNDKKKVAADSTTTVSSSTPTTTPTAAAKSCTPDPGSKSTATITTNYGTIVIALDDARAPKGTAHFVELAKKGFYNGLTWHRVVKDFVIQGGDPKGDGTGGSGSSVVAEVPKDNYPVGSLAAAKTGTDPAGTFDAQFFITTGSQGATLSNDYARFGCVTSGMDVAHKIEALAPNTAGGGAPTSKATMDKIVITQK